MVKNTDKESAGEMMSQKLLFDSDYMEGTHPAILEKMAAVNLEKNTGYGEDEYTADAAEKIRRVCESPRADVRFLIGGTQTNATVIDSMLASYQGVFCASTGHINGHEAGAVEAAGHKVIGLPQRQGKLELSDLAYAIEQYEGDDAREHMVMPGMVYLSQPTEYGTIYSLSELSAISELAHAHGLYLYVDGARLAYALGSPENDVSLSDLARLTDAFYIGGTKCGALFGEAVVIPRGDLIKHFFTQIKQHGALLAKGWLSGIQFGRLFEDGLYFRIGLEAVRLARKISAAFEQNGFALHLPTMTNQIFVNMEDSVLAEFSKSVGSSFWEKPDATHTVVRLATSWATTTEQADELIRVIENFGRR